MTLDWVMSTGAMLAPALVVGGEAGGGYDLSAAAQREVRAGARTATSRTGGAYALNPARQPGRPVCYEERSTRLYLRAGAGLGRGQAAFNLNRGPGIGG